MAVRSETLWPLRMGVLALLGFIAIPLIWNGYPRIVNSLIYVCWTDYFASHLWDGHLYPRWLVGASEQFGSGTFWYYPPFPS